MSKESESDLSKKLLTLKEKGLISADEYQKIASSGQLVEREFLKLLVSKYQLQGANISKIFEVLAAKEIPASVNENNSTLQNDGENGQSINPLQKTSKNPLLINAVVRGVFEYLTFDEIKQFRLVCQNWDFTAQPLLRRKGIIHFKPKTLEPATFLEAFENKLQDLPFTSFKFSNEGTRLPWSFSQLQIFFDKWGKNVKHLELMNISLEEGEKLRIDVNMTSCLEKATNLTKLKINIIYSDEDRYRYRQHPIDPTPLRIELDKLKSIKYLHLQGCTISNCDPKKNKITPLEIHLNQVYFKETKVEKLPIILNEYIDFRQATDIFLKLDKILHYGFPRPSLKKLCMASQEIKADNVYLNNVEIQNWKEAKGEIGLLTLFGMRLIERNELEIKKLILNSCTVDMAIIPLSIQQIQFEEGTQIICDHSVVLPELVFLGFRYISQNNFDMLSRFAACKNLVEIEIVTNTKGFNYADYDVMVKVSLIPKSVKRMKIQGYVNFVGDNSLHTLDKLIIQRNNVKPDFLTYATITLSDALELKVKVLVIDVSGGILHWNRVSDFVKLNKRFEKIVFGDLQRVFKNAPFERSSLFGCVDRKSDYYEFQTNVTTGKAISSSEFNSWCILTALRIS